MPVLNPYGGTCRYGRGRGGDDYRIFTVGADKDDHDGYDSADSNFTVKGAWW